MSRPSRNLRYFVAGLLVLAALPTFAQASDAFKNVVVWNTASNPVPVTGVGTQQVAGRVEVSNLPATHQLRHGSGVVSFGQPDDIIIPIDVVLTDVVVTRLPGSLAPLCEVALFEERDAAEHQGIQFVYLSDDERTEQLHLESGLTTDADAWGVDVNSDCVVRVLWSGYTA